MPRQLRLQYLGAMYHVMSRGNRRQKIFLDDVDRQDFIKTLAEACQKTGWQVLAPPSRTRAGERSQRSNCRLAGRLLLPERRMGGCAFADRNERFPSNRAVPC